MKSNKGYIDGATLFFFGLVALIAGLIMLIGFVLVGFPGGINESYSEGARVGNVIKLSQKGMVFKSWEGQAVLGGVVGKSDSDGNRSLVANVFDFNVSEAALPDIQAALESGKPVKLVYKQWLVRPIGISNNHVIVRVETK